MSLPADSGWMTAKPEVTGVNWRFHSLARLSAYCYAAVSVGGFGMKLLHQIGDVCGKVPDRFDAFRILPHLAGQPAEDHVPVR